MFCKEELQTVLKGLKNNKALGSGRAVNEFIIVAARLEELLKFSLTLSCSLEQSKDFSYYKYDFRKRGSTQQFYEH